MDDKKIDELSDNDVARFKAMFEVFMNQPVIAEKFKTSMQGSPEPSLKAAAIDDEKDLDLKNNFLLEERSHSLVAQSKFYEASSLLETLEFMDEADIGLNLLIAECYIQLGRENKAEKAIKNVKNILTKPPMCDIDVVIKLASDFIANSNNVRALLILRIAGEMFKQSSLSPDEKVSGIHRCGKKMKSPILSLIHSGNTSASNEIGELMKNLLGTNKAITLGEEVDLDVETKKAGIKGRAKVIAFDYGVSMAEEMLDDLREIEEADTDKKVVQHAMLANMINNIYSKSGQHAKALKILRTEIDYFEKHFGKNKNRYQIYITILVNIGAELHNEEKYLDSERIKLLALEEIEYVFDYDDEAERSTEIKRIRQSLKETQNHLKFA